LDDEHPILYLGRQKGPSMDSRHAIISEALELIFRGIRHLRNAFPPRAFTIDGRLVGDIGEIIAAIEYDIKLDDVSQPGHDGQTSDGRRRVQIKATFKDQLTFKTTPDYYLGFKLFEDGRYEEVFNGPGRLIQDRYAKRKNLGIILLAFPVSELKALSKSVPPDERIPKRTAVPPTQN
jgi:hypothetical protein